MKIAYIYFNSLNRKAANVIQVLNMLQSLGSITETVFVSSFISKRKYSNLLKTYGIENPKFKLRRTPFIFLGRSFVLEKIARLAYSFTSLIYLQIKRVDVVYTRDFAFLLFLSYLPNYLKPRQKILFEPHTIYHISSPHKVTKAQEGKALKEVDYFIPISEGIKKDLVGIFHVSEDKITVLPDAVNLDYVNSIAGDRKYLNNRYDFKEKDMVLVYTGTFKDWKGVDILVKSIRYINNKNVKALLIGGSSSEIDDIKLLINQEGVGNRVVVDRFLPQGDIIKILKSSDIAVIPNKTTEIGARYTSPLKLFEYMACGLPIVCSDLPAMRETLQEKENCLYFIPDNPKSLAESLDILITKRDLRSSMSLSNISTVDRYSWSERARSIIELTQNANR